MNDTTDENHVPVALPKKRLSIGCLALLIVGGSLAVLLLGAFTVGLVWRSQQYHAIAEERARLTSLGKPLTLAELDASYRVQPEQYDATPEWLAALAEFSSSTAMSDLETLTDAASENSLMIKDVPAADRIAYLAKHDLLFEKIRIASAAGTNVRYPVDLKQGFAAKLHEGPKLYRIGRILEVQFAQAIAEQKVGLAIETAGEMFAAGETLAREPSLSSLRMRFAILFGALASMEMVLVTQALNEPQLAALETLLASLELRDGLRLGVNGHRVSTIAIIRGEQDMDPQIDAALGIPRNLPTLVAVERNAMESYAQFEAAIEQVELSDMLLEMNRADADTKQRSLESQIPLTGKSLTIPETSSIVRFLVRTETHRRLLLAGIAAEQFRARTGSLPQSWQELSDDLPGGVPLDPYTNQPLRLNVITDPTGPPRSANSASDPDAPVGRGISIYSVGLNQVDDGGLYVSSNETSDDESLFLPEAKP